MNDESKLSLMDLALIQAIEGAFPAGPNMVAVPRSDGLNPFS